MNNLGYFISLEKKTGDSEIGDRTEASLTSLSGHIFVRFPESHKSEELHYLGKNFLKTLRYSEVKKIPIFSMSIFKACDFKKHSEDNLYIYFKLSIGKDSEAFINMGNTAIILPSDFIKGLKQTKEYNESKLSYKEITYYDYQDSEFDKRKVLFKNSSEEMFYWKHKDYSYQREARIVLHGIRVNKHYIFNHGFKREDFLKISTEDFFENFVIGLPKKDIEKL